MFAAVATAVLVTPLRLIQRPRHAWPITLLLAYGGVVAFAAAQIGVIVLREKRRQAPSTARWPWIVVVTLVVTSLAFLGYSVMERFVLGMALSPLGLLLAWKQWRVLRAEPQTDGPGWWLQAHIGQMLGACIATITAAVVNNGARLFGLSSFWIWIAPLAILLPILIVMKRRYADPVAVLRP
jgi:hypothetical protein